MKLLDGKVAGVEMRPESHMADEKRVDIECSAFAAVMVPVEIKGQWHKEIWNAADTQLDKLYSADWRADRRGIYLILWFGAGTPLTAPPAGIATPTTPEESCARRSRPTAPRAGPAWSTSSSSISPGLDGDAVQRRAARGEDRTWPQRATLRRHSAIRAFRPLAPPSAVDGRAMC